MSASGERARILIVDDEQQIRWLLRGVLREHYECAEALVRWRSPRLGLVPPAEFIPLAEATGLIVPVGEWVLREAARQCGDWQKRGFGPLRVAVNLSPRQFRQAGLADVVRVSLLEADLDPGFLELEVTESSLVSNQGTAIITLPDTEGTDFLAEVADAYPSSYCVILTGSIHLGGSRQ